MGIKVRFIEKTQAQLDALTSGELVDLALYFATDTHRIYRAQGGALVLYGAGFETDQFLDGGRADEVYQANDTINAGGA